jgi:membrane dipeptidase
MVHRIVLFILVVCIVSTGLSFAQPAQVVARSIKDLQKAARSLHERIITIDTHDDISPEFATSADDPGNPNNPRQVTLQKMSEGGLDAGFFIVYVGQGERTEEGYKSAYEQAIVKFDAIHRMAETLYSDRIAIASTADDVERIYASGKLVACIGIENGWPIGKDISKLKEFYDRGGRYITLAHNGHNDICDSANPFEKEPAQEHGGVSTFGKQVIDEMNRLGIMVDISHISKQAALDAMRLSKSPVIASHSAARALNDNPRNIDDETLLALKKNGGVIQCVALGAFVRNPVDSPERRAALETLVKDFHLPATRGRLYREALDSLSAERVTIIQQRRNEIDRLHPPSPPVTVEEFVGHIDHVVKLIGIDHVGISSDFDGGGGIQGWNHAGETYNVTAELLKRGYSEEEIQKIWGGNLLRVWRENERIATSLQRQ